MIWNLGFGVFTLEAFGASQNSSAFGGFHPLEIGLFSFFWRRVIIAAKLLPGSADNGTFAAYRALFHNR